MVKKAADMTTTTTSPDNNVKKVVVRHLAHFSSTVDGIYIYCGLQECMAKEPEARAVDISGVEDLAGVVVLAYKHLQDEHGFI